MKRILALMLALLLLMGGGALADMQSAGEEARAQADKLDEKERRIVFLRYFKGKTQMEVANEIGISQAQVSRLEKSAINSMRKDYL